MEDQWQHLDRIMAYVVWPAVGLLIWWLRQLQDQIRSTLAQLQAVLARTDTVEKEIMRLCTILEERNRRRDEDRDIARAERENDQRMIRSVVAQLHAAIEKLSDKIEKGR
jgi:hypothetical protein